MSDLGIDFTTEFKFDWSSPFETPTDEPVLEEWPSFQIFMETMEHRCPLTDPANAGKAMLFYCPVCNGNTTC